MINNLRFDLSNYLIHFFRDVNLDGAEPILFPRYAYFNNMVNSSALDALFLMRCSIRHNKIFATWSYRNARPTIYGKSPAVCFTDMPLAAFIQTSEERRRRGENIGRYALVLPKTDIFKLGARPVIYGLSSEHREVFNSNKKQRILSGKNLPPHEQFRYVAFNLEDERPIDWTHEREWRWPYRGNESHFGPNGEVKESLEELPGLNLKEALIEGAGILVQDKEDVRKVIFDILTLVDSGAIRRSMFKFIISIGEIGSFGDIRDPSRVSEIIDSNKINLDYLFEIDEELAHAMCCAVDNIIERSVIYNSTYGVECFYGVGKSWVWLVDNDSDLVRALVAEERLIISKEGRYLLDISSIPNFPREYEEYFCKLVADSVEEMFGVSCSYFTVRDGIGCDQIPYFTDFYDLDHPFYNYAVEVD